MIVRVWRYYFGRGTKEIWFALLSATCWTIVVHLLDYVQDEWLVVVTLGYIGGMAARVLLGNIALGILESRLERALEVHMDWEEAMLAQNPQYGNVARVSRYLGIVMGAVMLYGSLLSLTFVLTSVLLAMLQLPSLDTTLVKFGSAYVIACTSIYTLLAGLFHMSHTSVDKADKQQDGKSHQGLWVEVLQNGKGLAVNM